MSSSMSSVVRMHHLLLYQILIATQFARLAKRLVYEKSPGSCPGFLKSEFVFLTS